MKSWAGSLFLILTAITFFMVTITTSDPVYGKTPDALPRWPDPPPPPAGTCTGILEEPGVTDGIYLRFRIEVIREGIREGKVITGLRIENFPLDDEKQKALAQKLNELQLGDELLLEVPLETVELYDGPYVRTNHVQAAIDLLTPLDFEALDITVNASSTALVLFSKGHPHQPVTFH